MAAVYDDSGRADQTYGNSGPGAKLNIISFIGLISGLLLIVNRLLWRWKKGTPGIDDLIIVLAWLMLLGLGVVTFIAVDYGYGRSNASLTRVEASNAIRMFYLYQIFYKLTLNLSKLSILSLYLRVFDTKDWFGNITKFLIFIVSTYTTSIILANILICRPISTYWSTTDSVPNDNDSSKNEHPGTCINILAYWYASSLYNILSESLMLFSVLARIWTLPSHSHPPILQFRQKVNLTIVLGLGVFTVITAILRMTTLNETAMATDRTGGSLTSTIWSSVEAVLGLAVANLPMVRQLLRWKGWCGGRWFRSSAEKSRSQSRSRSRAQQGGPGYTLAAPQQSLTLGAYGPAGKRADLHVDDARVSPNLSLTLPQDSERQTEKSKSRTFEEIYTYSSDIENDVDSIGPLQPINSHLQTLSATATPKGINISIRSSSLITSTNLHSNTPTRTSASRDVHGGNDGDADTDTPTSSITSTLRNPTEPIPMVRISTEPSGIEKRVVIG